MCVFLFHVEPISSQHDPRTRSSLSIRLPRIQLALPNDAGINMKLLYMSRRIFLPSFSAIIIAPPFHLLFLTQRTTKLTSTKVSIPLSFLWTSLVTALLGVVWSVPHTSLFSCQLSISCCRNPFCQLPFSLIGQAYTCKLGQCLSDRICHSSPVATLGRTATSLNGNFAAVTFKGFFFLLIFASQIFPVCAS